MVPERWIGGEMLSNATPEKNLARDRTETLMDGFSIKLRHWHFF